MNKPKKYDKEFKINVVKHYRESGKSLRQICIDFALPTSTLNGWIKEFAEQGEQSFRGSGKPKACNEELYRLRKELADVKQERDILKKAMAIFSRAEKRGYNL